MEANTCGSIPSMSLVVMSGLGFENGGVSGAHALGVGITALPNMEKKYLHGEMVALGDGIGDGEAFQRVQGIG